MKPGVAITFENGQIGSVATNPDGVCAIVASATANATFELNKHYVVFSLKDAEDLGILPTVANYELHKTIKEFYAEAGNGVELWIYGVAKTRTYTQLVEDARTVLTISNRRIRFVVLKYAPAVVDTTTANGLVTGFVALLAQAQNIAEEYYNDKTHPVVFVFEGYGYTGVSQDLPSFELATHNRVMVMLGDTEKRTGTTATMGAAVGVLAGSIAKNQVHVNIGRVKNGALDPLTFYLVDTPVEQVNINPIYDKGFVTPTTHVGKSGYYLSDDLLACAIEDDYHYLTRRRVIDKAAVLAYQTLTNYILDTVPLTGEGKMQASYAKGIEAEVERVITQEMTARGELSADVTVANDTGVQCVVDTNEIIAQTSTLKGKIKVRPHGYNRFIEFTIGFNINN